MILRELYTNTSNLLSPDAMFGIKTKYMVDDETKIIYEKTIKNTVFYNKHNQSEGTLSFQEITPKISPNGNYYKLVSGKIYEIFEKF